MKSAGPTGTADYDEEQISFGAEDFGTQASGTAFNSSLPNQMSDSPPDIDTFHSMSQQPFYSISTDDNDEASSIQYIQPEMQQSSVVQPETQQSSMVQPAYNNNDTQVMQPEAQQIAMAQPAESFPRPLYPDAAGPMPALEIPIARLHRRSYRGRGANVRPQAPPIASHLSSVLLQPVP